LLIKLSADGVANVGKIQFQIPFPTAQMPHAEVNSNQTALVLANHRSRGVIT
jgi:hypothetical protein